MNTFSTETFIKIDAFATGVKRIQELADNTKRPDRYLILVNGSITMPHDSIDGHFDKVIAKAQIWLYKPIVGKPFGKSVDVAKIDIDLCSVSMDDIDSFFGEAILKLNTISTPEMEIVILKEKRRGVIDNCNRECDKIDAEIERLNSEL